MSFTIVFGWLVGWLVVLSVSRMERILHKLSSYYGKVDPWKGRSAFEVLLRTVISQNTSDVNTDRAFARLSEKFNISAKVISKAKISELEACLEVGGLYKQKSKRLKKIAQTIVEDFGGDLEFLGDLPVEEARTLLLNFEGVGEKTADVLLSFYFNKPKIAIDTHIFRVAKRLSYGGKRAKYSEIQSKLEAEIAEEQRLQAHLLLITHGRSLCTARKPKCYNCPIVDECPYKDKNL